MTWRSRVAGLAALLLLLVTALGASCSHGARLTKVVRTDKTSIIGTLVSMRPDMVVLKTPGGLTVEIPRKEISSIEEPTLSEIAAIQGAGSGASAANGGATNPSGGGGTPTGGGTGPGAGQSADAGGGTSGSGAPGAGGTGAGGTGDASGGGAGGAGNPGGAPGQQASNPGGTSGPPSGQPGGTSSSASNRLPSGSGIPSGGIPGSGVPTGGGSAPSGGSPGSGSPGGGSPGGGSPGGGTLANRTPTGGRSVLLPANAEMTVSLESELGSDTSHVEEEVYATLTRPVTIDGATRVPAGARLRGTITEAVPGAKANGRGRLAVRFHTLIVDSASIPIETYPMRYVAGRLSKEDAKKIGMGAAAGAAIGRILSKTKKGLGIGAAAGAGGTAAALSRRPDIRLDSGTTLRIKLQKLVPQPAS